MHHTQIRPPNRSRDPLVLRNRHPALHHPRHKSVRFTTTRHVAASISKHKPNDVPRHRSHDAKKQGEDVVERVEDRRAAKKSIEKLEKDKGRFGRGDVDAVIFIALRCGGVEGVAVDGTVSDVSEGVRGVGERGGGMLEREIREIREREGGGRGLVEELVCLFEGISVEWSGAGPYSPSTSFREQISPPRQKYHAQPRQSGPPVIFPPSPELRHRDCDRHVSISTA